MAQTQSARVWYRARKRLLPEVVESVYLILGEQMNKENYRSVINTLSTNHWNTCREVSDLTGHSYKSAYSSLRTLVDNGVVTKTRQGDSTVYRLVQLEKKSWLERAKGLFLRFAE